MSKILTFLFILPTVILWTADPSLKAHAKPHHHPLKLNLHPNPPNQGQGHHPHLETLEITNSSKRAHLIIGGEDAKPGEFPWQVSLQLPDWEEKLVPFCGGSIIGPSHILTAAHCIYDGDLTGLQVVAGAHDIFNPDGTEQVVKVLTSSFHKSFDRKTFDNDIALLSLKRPLVYNDRVQPIKLPSSNIIPNGNCINTGWGATNNDGGPPAYPDVLQKVTLQSYERSVCEEKWARVNPITQGMICAGDDAKHKGSCVGDSGGPMICMDVGQGQEYYLAGIVSWGEDPCVQTTHYPSVFTNVPHYAGWIQKETGNL